MKNSKKIISLLSAITFIFSTFVPTFVFAETTEPVSLLDIGFADSDKSRVAGLWEDYGWTKIQGGELWVAPTAVETSVRIALSEAVDLSDTSKVGYTVEMKAQMPIPNDGYSTPYLSLADSSNSHAIGAEGGTLYAAMRNNFALAALGEKSQDGTKSSLRMLNEDATTEPVGMATAAQYRTLKYTFANGKVKFEATVDGVTTSTTTKLSNLTNTKEGNGYHVAGRTYDYIILGNNSTASRGTGTMYVDYLKVSKFTPEEEEEEPEPNEVFDPTYNGELANYEFDGNDDSTKINLGANAAGYSWIRYASSQLAMNSTPYEQPVYLALDKAMDLSSDKIYTIETRLKSPIDNYRYMALTNGTNNGLMYQTMMNNFMIANYTTGINDSSKKVQIAGITDGIGSATANEWKTYKYTFSKNYYELEVTVERESGNVTSVTSGALSSLSATTAGNGRHVTGKLYNQIVFANTYSTAEMTVDYVKASVKDDDTQNPWVPREFNDPDDPTARTSITDSKCVRIIGRGEATVDGSRTFNWSSAGFEFKFTGTYADVFVSDCAGTSYFNVSIDGETPNRMVLNSGWNAIAQELENKEHTIKVTRSSSAQHGTLKISTIRSDGALTATQEPTKKIEFIGDSYTTGYGNLINAAGESAETTDSRQSYAGYIANKFKAEETLIAYAGRGVVKGYSPDSTNEMPVQFGLQEICMDWGGAGRNMSTGAKQDYTKNVPQYVVIWLGTNDYANNVDATAFQAGYEDLLTKVRTAYPNAPILCLTKAYEGYPTQVNAAITKLGGEKAHIYYEAVNSFSASSIGHPSVNEAKAIGQEVYERLLEINNIEKLWTIEEETEEPETELVKERVTLADFEFDGNDDPTKISGLQDYYVWLRPVNSELACNYNPYEIPIELTLDKPIDLSSGYTYEIEIRAKLPVNNYRAIGLRDTNVAKNTMYTSMINNFILHYAGDMDGDARKIQINPNSSKQTSIGAKGDEWTTLKYTLNKNKVMLDMSVEGNDGQTRTSTVKVNLDTLTKAAGGTGGHVEGRTYEKVMLGNLNTGTEMTVDYVKVARYVDETADDGPDNKVFDPNYTGKLAYYEFDGNDDDDMIDLGANSASYSWISYINSHLSLVANPYEQPTYLALDKAIDLSSDKVYEIEVRMKSPISNYRYFSLTNGTNNGLMYQTMFNNFMLANTTDGDDANSKKIQLSETTTGVGNATSDEWKVMKYTLSKNYYELEVTVEKTSGNVTTVISGPLSEITASTAGSGKHVTGKIYNQIAFANTYSTGEMNVDYVKASVKDDNTSNPWKPLALRNTEILSVKNNSADVNALTGVTTGDTLTVTVDYANAKGVAGTYSLFGASYDENGTVIDISKLGDKAFESTTKEDTSSFNYTVSDVSNIKEIKFFLWDSLAGLKPIDSVVTIK